jgi:hypothetical protein
MMDRKSVRRTGTAVVLAAAVTLTDNRSTGFSGSRTTVALSGSFSVRALTANRPGTDVIVARATRGSQTCAGSVRL